MLVIWKILRMYEMDDPIFKMFNSCCNYGCLYLFDTMVNLFLTFNYKDKQLVYLYTIFIPLESHDAG